MIDEQLLVRLDSVDALRERTFVEELSGGLTNLNLKVTTPTGTYVARLSSEQSSLLAIDRAAEHSNSRAAAESGAAPAVLAYVPEQSLLVVEYVNGRTWTERDVLDPVNALRIGAACRKLHAGPRFVNEFNMLALQPHYLSIVQQRDFVYPTDTWTSLSRPTLSPTPSPSSRWQLCPATTTFSQRTSSTPASTSG
jgi:thiamine kinase-like enzyme